jgi:hypothetical protein
MPFITPLNAQSYLTQNIIAASPTYFPPSVPLQWQLVFKPAF